MTKTNTRPEGFLLASGDSRLGDHSYTGWTETQVWQIDDGRTFRRSVGCGAFCHDYVEAECYQDDEGHRPPRRPLPMSVVRAARLTTTVPSGTVVVAQSRGGEKSYERWSAYEVFGPGSEIPAGILGDLDWAQAHGWSVLANGQHVDVHRGDHAGNRAARITNRAGRAVESDEPERARRREFAAQQRAALRQAGASEADIRLLFDHAGPRMSVRAWEWFRSSHAALGTARLRALLSGDTNGVFSRHPDRDCREALEVGLIHVPFGVARACDVLAMFGLPGTFTRAWQLNRTLAAVAALLARPGLVEIPGDPRSVSTTKTSSPAESLCHRPFARLARLAGGTPPRP